MVIWSDPFTSKACLLSEGSLSRGLLTPDLHDRGRSSPAQPAAWPPSPSPWQSPPRSHSRNIYNHPTNFLTCSRSGRNLDVFWMIHKKNKGQFSFQYDFPIWKYEEYVVVISEWDLSDKIFVVAGLLYLMTLNNNWS